MGGSQTLLELVAIGFSRILEVWNVGTFKILRNPLQLPGIPRSPPWGCRLRRAGTFYPLNKTPPPQIHFLWYKIQNTETFENIGNP